MANCWFLDFCGVPPITGKQAVDVRMATRHLHLAGKASDNRGIRWIGLGYTCRKHQSRGGNLDNLVLKAMFSVQYKATSHRLLKFPSYHCNLSSRIHILFKILIFSICWRTMEYAAGTHQSWQPLGKHKWQLASSSVVSALHI